MTTTTLSKTNTPIDQKFNEAVLYMTKTLVGGYIVSDDAPGTFSALKEHMDAGNTMVVAAAGSDYTIFGKAEVNWAFRAWHDYTHWRYNNDFSLYGETLTAIQMTKDMFEALGCANSCYRWMRILDAEIIGQRRYYSRYLSYINDQRAFALAYMDDPEKTLQSRW